MYTDIGSDGAVQVDSIMTRVVSTYGFSACSYNMKNCFQTLLSHSNGAATTRAPRNVPAAAAGAAAPAAAAVGARVEAEAGLDCHPPPSVGLSPTPLSWHWSVNQTNQIYTGMVT